MALSFPHLSSVFLMIVMGLNQAGSEPGMYWDKVLPNTPMPSAIKKLLPQVVVMKPADIGKVVDGGFDLGRKGAGDKFDPISNGKPIEGVKSNHPSAIPANYFEVAYSASKKQDASGNAVDSEVNFIEGTKSNHPPAIPANYFEVAYSASKKPDASGKAVDSEVNFIEGTKSNHPSAIPANSFEVAYSASKNPGASGNAVNSEVNFIEGTKSNHMSVIPANYFEVAYSASKKPDASGNDVDSGVNFIEGTKSNHLSAIPANYFEVAYSASKKSDASGNAADSEANFIEGTKSNHPSAISANYFEVAYSASKKSDVSGNVVDSEKSNHPSAIPDNYFEVAYSASKKPDASENAADGKANFIEGTKSNHPSTIPANYFEVAYSASKKPDTSGNAADGKANFIEGTKSNHPSAIPANYFEVVYSASKKPEASRNTEDGGINLSPRESGVNIDKTSDPITAIFFHRNDLLPGKQFNLLLTSEDGRSAAFIPRQEADAIPFSTSELPSILSRYSIPPGSNAAVEMRNTLDTCEMQTVAGVEKQCVTSLEAMVDFATKRLGTHDVATVAMEGGDAYAAEVRPYKVKAVKRIAVAGGNGVVSCHPLPYAYAVFYCHHSTTNEVYSVDLIVEDDGATMMKVVAVCHLDTSMWKPETPAFKVLGLEPGKGAVCHFLPRKHVSWVAKL